MKLVFRSPDQSDMTNYRPITNLSTMSKILEKLAIRHLTPHVMSTGNFNEFQSAYRAGHSTETALLKIVNDRYICVQPAEDSSFVAGSLGHI